MTMTVGTAGRHISLGTRHPGTPGTALIIPLSTGATALGTIVLTIHQSTGAIILGITADGTTLGTMADGMTLGTTADGTVMTRSGTAATTVDGTEDGMEDGTATITMATTISTEAAESILRGIWRAVPLPEAE